MFKQISFEALSINHIKNQVVVYLKTQKSINATPNHIKNLNIENKEIGCIAIFPLIPKVASTASVEINDLSNF
jgi:hypothetical protein